MIRNPLPYIAHQRKGDGAEQSLEEHLLGVAETVEIARKMDTNVRRKPAELFDNSFAEDLEKSGFLKEFWGGKIP